MDGALMTILLMILSTLFSIIIVLECINCIVNKGKIYRWMYLVLGIVISVAIWCLMIIFEL